MNERPILFSDPMVRALLSGQKTQTRRVVKPEIALHMPAGANCGSKQPFRCPYGQPGDRLWVREAFHAYHWDKPRAVYRADGLRQRVRTQIESYEVGRWKPSIHMPRWACRLVLEIVSVRVERLRDISEADAMAEGVESPDTERTDHDPQICPQCGGTRLYTAHSIDGARPDTDCEKCDTNAKRFRHLWGSINGDESWVANPWVWCIEFRRVQP